MRILVTNDDGIDSVGLHVLAQAMTAHGDVVVVAPDREYSGAGAALGAHAELQLLLPARDVVPGDVPADPDTDICPVRSDVRSGLLAIAGPGRVQRRRQLGVVRPAVGERQDHRRAEQPLSRRRNRRLQGFEVDAARRG